MSSERGNAEGAAAHLAIRPSWGSRLAGVEGLRAIAASSIVVVHVWGMSSPGGVKLGSPHVADAISTLSAGVTLFFTLSGFLLYRPFAAAIARGSRPVPIATYLRNRVLRIAPAYWVILMTTAVIVGVVGVRLSSGVLGVGRLADPIRLLGAALLLQDYRRSTMLDGLGPAWSLAVEAVFYCALPLLVLAAARVAKGTSDRRGRVLILLGPPLLLLLVGLSGKAVAAFLLPGTPGGGYGPNWHSVVERSFWAQADLFSFGMVVAVLHVEVADGRVRMPRHWRRAALGLALLIFLPCAATMHEAEHSYLPQNTGEALGIALAFAALMIPDANAIRPTRAVRFLEAPALVAVGVASYSLFLWHWPIINWLKSHGVTAGGWGGLLLNLALVALIAGALSALTYRFVERPALRRKARAGGSPHVADRTVRSAAETAARPAAGGAQATQQSPA